MSEEINKVTKQEANILDLMEEVGQLKIKEKDKRIEDLERRVDEMEQYSHIDNLIISGFKITHQTYARAGV